MSDIVITAKNLSKRYLVGHQSAQRDRKTTLRDVIGHEVRNFARKTVDFVRGRQIVQGDKIEEFWALKDVSFEVKRGEVFGIIGRNGAGKSTLLKILSRITEPDRGRAILRGRVASLLEVGTGFHWELTGRENIFLNGAILGMTRAEIVRKFDEIVAFADVEEFLDTPVKRYSSGMYVRLAFGVAAHMEPEILIVDEVLAVGDLEFQKKCLGKMSDVVRGGRTVLFVSHNMQSILTLCEKALVLHKGALVFDGNAKDAVLEYASINHRFKEAIWTRSSDRDTRGVAFEELSVTVVGEQPSLKLICSIRTRTVRPRAPSLLTVDITDAFGTSIMQADPTSMPFVPGEPGDYEFSMEISLPALIPGTYWLSYWIGPNNMETYDFVPNALAFEVNTSPIPGRTFPHKADHGYVVAQSKCVLVKAERINNLSSIVRPSE
jgi:lipopolysaccharide transport system ATP-binding protein